MRWVIGVVTLAVLVWGGWWYVAATGAQRGAEASIDTLRAQGHQMQHDGLSVQGFPNRIDLTLTNPAFRSADGQIGWTSAFAQVFSLTYKPWHLIATVAPEQRLTTPAGEVTLVSPRMRASVIARPTTSLPLDRFALDAEPLSVRANGQTLDAARLTLASRAAPALPDAHDIGLRIEGLVLPQIPATLPAQIESLLIEAQVSFTAPLDRHAGQTRPQPTVIDLRNLQSRWGDLKLQAEGRLTPDPQGLVQGEITLRLTNWRLILPVLVEAGVITPEFRPNLENALSLMASKDSSGDEQLILPVKLARGAMALGPLPIGPAPAFPRW
jgi:hypothetical protein